MNLQIFTVKPEKKKITFEKCLQRMDGDMGGNCSVFQYVVDIVIKA